MEAPCRKDKEKSIRIRMSLSRIMFVHARLESDVERENDRKLDEFERGISAHGVKVTWSRDKDISAGENCVLFVSGVKGGGAALHAPCVDLASDMCSMLLMHRDAHACMYSETFVCLCA